jgi:hypothetical protein
VRCVSCRFACVWALIPRLQNPQIVSYGIPPAALESALIQRLDVVGPSLSSGGSEHAPCTGCLSDDPATAAHCRSPCLSPCEREVVAWLTGHHLSFIANNENWLCRAVEAGLLPTGALEDGGAPGDVYAAALLVSMLQLVGGVSTILPTNTFEYAFFFFAVLAGAVLFAAVQGIICGVVTNGDPDETRWRQNNDALNFMMEVSNGRCDGRALRAGRAGPHLVRVRDATCAPRRPPAALLFPCSTPQSLTWYTPRLAPSLATPRSYISELTAQDTNMPNEARLKVREYFQKSKKLFKRRSYAALIDSNLSEEMQGDVRYLISFEVFDGVWWLKELDRQFLEDLSIRLRRVAFAPKEIISGDQLNILTHGMATRDGAFKSPGHWWGDVFITSRRLRDTTPATCLLYCEVARLTRHDLLEVRRRGCYTYTCGKDVTHQRSHPTSLTPSIPAPRSLLPCSHATPSPAL